MNRAHEFAFPVNTENANNSGAFVPQGGLTIREHFAAMAMHGLLARHGDDDYTDVDIARKSRIYADALIAELSKVQS